MGEFFTFFVIKPQTISSKGSREIARYLIRNSYIQYKCNLLKKYSKLNILTMHVTFNSQFRIMVWMLHKLKPRPSKPIMKFRISSQEEKE